MGRLYLVYLRDPDGNKLCALHRPKKSSAWGGARRRAVIGYRDGGQGGRFSVAPRAMYG